ncbi:GntR family transcriptional regulator [Scopulibacillus darangshiensis]|uniref:GntR family transcriptional regulator n=1 Tax=Scopulibacillus darangshiensis TaxID=442528 RepID=A0A4R2P5A8_9BACL|nr:GntR family transcriptional regulator [Scopulibacillus darangshiensis]TCP29962.1 GntR family transcriptional regulator [Scopulibacillus darangshiensis]
MNITRKKGPLYLQIKNILKDRILHGAYTIGTNIPPEPQLEEEFGVSKVTVRNAIKELVQEGYLEKRSGKGTKVIRNTSASKLSKGKRFTEVLVEEGHKIQKQLIKLEVIYNQVGSKLYQLFGEHCLRVERLYRLDEMPYIHYTHYLTERMEGADHADFNCGSLYELIEEQNISLEKFRDQFAVAAAPSYAADRLGVKRETPLLKRSRYSYDERGDLVEYSEGYYNTELQDYIVNYDV